MRKRSGEDVSVRFAVPADLDFVSHDGFIPQEVIVRKVAQSEVFVAEAGGQPVGYLRLEYLWSLVPYVALIWVVPEYRKRGVGRAMIAFIGEFLRQNGHEVVYSSSQVNEPAPQAWHRYVGFEECGVINGINEGGIGEVFFRKFLR
jgi:GNAT superfamily N-acetyltransferase